MTLAFSLMGERVFPWFFVYFHGWVEEYVTTRRAQKLDMSTDRTAPDLVSCDTPCTRDRFPTGIYHCMVYGKEATLFIWWDEKQKDLTRGQRGLIVFGSDRHGYEWAQNKFFGRASSI